MPASSSSNGFYHRGNKITRVMLSNRFSFKMLYAAFKESRRGIREEKYKNHRTSRSQSAALSAGRMQDRAVRQETSVLCIALFLTQGMTLGHLLKSSYLSFILATMGPGGARGIWRVCVEFTDSQLHLFSPLLQSFVK